MNNTNYSNTAIVILAHSDYESLELSLAVHAKFLPYHIDGKRVKIYILQNGRYSYDCERTLMVAKRYRDLFPKDIEVIEDIPPQEPYFAIRKLLNSERFCDIDHIIKLDDDVFPLTKNWAENLWSCFQQSKLKYPSELAYVTSLVNNNPWGFKKTIELMNLEEEYFSEVAREHLVGSSPTNSLSPYRINPPEKISTGGHGTIWRYAYIARWLHEKTTLHPKEFIQSTVGKGYEEIFSKERYSINCMLFEKDLWFKIFDGDTNDEGMFQKYCIRNNLKIIADLEVPMCHLFFYTQRFENKDLLPIFRNFYSKWLDLPFPIALNEDRIVELEARLRHLEKKNLSRIDQIKVDISYDLKNRVKKRLSRHPLLYKTVKYIYKRLK